MMMVVVVMVVMVVMVVVVVGLYRTESRLIVSTGLQAVINCQTVGEDGEECFTSNNRRTLMMHLR